MHKTFLIPVENACVFSPLHARRYILIELT